MILERVNLPDFSQPKLDDPAVAIGRARRVAEEGAREALFAEKVWLSSPEPFFLPAETVQKLEQLGHQLWKFQKACNLLYRQSVKKRQPAWIADYLDRGKPADLIEIARGGGIAEDLPGVIRPDLILTDDGIAITELDTVPGGIGLTAWLAEIYSSMGFEVLGGPSGMVERFSNLLGESAKIAVSREAATYRPEMEWIAKKVQQFRGNDTAVPVVDAEDLCEFEGTLYRFFELFDLPNLPAAKILLNRAQPRITPPPKPYLEEKLWFALFWMKPLKDFWRMELGDRYYRDLQKVIPMTWILDPTPIPHFAEFPGLGIQSWQELEGFSQKQRDLVLKISGFSEKAWGARGVVMAQDLPQTEWSKAVQAALGAFPTHPHILQPFHKGRLVEQRYLGTDGETLHQMKGRVRLCPYYFVEKGKVYLGGGLATLCAADKKILHGMRDAIMSPIGVH